MRAGSEEATQRKRPGPSCLALLLGCMLLLTASSLPAALDPFTPQRAEAAPPAPPPPPPPAWPPSARERVPARVPAAPPVVRPAAPTRPAPPRVPQPRVPQPVRPPIPAAPIPAAPLPSDPPAPSGPPQPSAQPLPMPAEGERADPAAERPLIRRIEFEGNLLYASEMLKTRLRNKEGQRLDPALLDLDMKELYRYFREIQVVEDRVAGGVILRFRVSENPLILRLEIRGNEALDDSEIRNLLRTKEGFPLSPYHVAADREDVAEAYRMRGHHFAHVPEPEVLTLPGGGRRVVFSVVEGPPVSVSRIVFRGNSYLERKQLLGVMVTEAPNFLEEVLGELSFRQDVLEQDLVSIKQLYRSEGFLDAEVALDDLRFSDDKTRVEVSISITEHQPYTVGRVEFDIEREDPGKIASPTPEDIAYFTDPNLLALFGLKEGERFSGMKAEMGLGRIRNAYYERSYINASVGDRDTGTVQLRGRERELVVDIKISIREGPKFRLARIDFVGNEYTRDKILRREVKTAPGGYVDRTRLDQGLAAIRRLNYFDRSTLRIDDAIGPDGETIEGWKRATYELVEGRTGNVTFGVALSTNGGFGASVNFSKRNFDIARWPTSFADITSGRAWTGAGQEFDLLINPGTEYAQFRARFREPRFFGSRFSFETSVYKRLAFREDYRTDRLGYTVGIGYPLLQRDDNTVALFGEVTWRHELVDIDDIDPDAVPGVFLFSEENELRSLTGSLSLVTRSDSIKPTFETRSSLAAEYAGGFLGGDLEFWKVTGRTSATWVVHEDEDGKKHRVAARLSAGISEAFGSTPEVPPYERYFAGGRTFRGFDFRGVGPHVNGEPIGGEFLLLGSLEYEFPIVARTLSLVVFTDQGTLGTSLSDDDAFRWRISVGAGLRFAIPFLTGNRPMALDFGFPIYSEAEDEEGVFSFSLGRDL